MATVTATKEFQWQLNVPLLGLFGLVFLLFISLGIWQIARAEQKQTLLDQQRQGAINASHSVSNFDYFDGSEYQSVRLFGQFQVTKFWHLQNQIVDGQIGNDILAAFTLTNGQTIIVNLGWLAKDVEVTPAINASPVTITGFVRKPMDLPFVKNIFTPGQESIVEIIPGDFPQANIVSDWYLQIAPSEPMALTTHWQVKTMSPDKHMGYAVQWFSMAAVLFVALVFSNSNLAVILGFKSSTN
jgi:cytochrome oxidase assembly protein ShyY1